MRSLNFHLFTDRFCVSSQVPRKSGFYEQVTGDMKGGDEDMSIAENFGRKGSAPGVLKRDLQFHADLNRMNRPKEAQAKTRRGRQAVTSCPKYAVVWAGKVGYGKLQVLPASKLPLTPFSRNYRNAIFTRSRLHGQLVCYLIVGE
jgi:hypothetical protein